MRFSKDALLRYERASFMLQKSIFQSMKQALL